MASGPPGRWRRRRPPRPRARRPGGRAAAAAPARAGRRPRARRRSPPPPPQHTGGAERERSSTAIRRSAAAARSAPGRRRRERQACHRLHLHGAVAPPGRDDRRLHQLQLEGQPEGPLVRSRRSARRGLGRPEPPDHRAGNSTASTSACRSWSTEPGRHEHHPSPRQPVQRTDRHHGHREPDRQHERARPPTARRPGAAAPRSAPPPPRAGERHGSDHQRGGRAARSAARCRRPSHR